jgi:hypothetical protein
MEAPAIAAARNVLKVMFIPQAPVLAGEGAPRQVLRSDEPKSTAMLSERTSAFLQQKKTL